MTVEMAETGGAVSEEQQIKKEDGKLDRLMKWVFPSAFWLGALIFLFAICFKACDLHHLSKEAGNWELDAGFGDFVGGAAGSLWNLAAIALLYLTYRSQKQELHEARKAFMLQREELADTRKAMEDQGFENNFWQLLKAQRDLAGNVSASFINGMVQNVLGEDNIRGSKFFGLLKIEFLIGIRS